MAPAPRSVPAPSEPLRKRASTGGRTDRRGAGSVLEQALELPNTYREPDMGRGGTRRRTDVPLTTPRANAVPGSLRQEWPVAGEADAKGNPRAALGLEGRGPPPGAGHRTVPVHDAAAAVAAVLPPPVRNRPAAPRTLTDHERTSCPLTYLVGKGGKKFRPF